MASTPSPNKMEMAGHQYHQYHQYPHHESTPLIHHRRHRHNKTFRRFFFIAIASALLWGLFSSFFHALLAWPRHNHYHPTHNSRYSVSHHRASTLTYDHLKSILLDTPDPEQAREWSKYYTSGAHLAGKNYSQADWTRQKWQSWGIPSTIVDYDVYLNYPVNHSLSLLQKSQHQPSRWRATFNASLEEDALEKDSTTSSKQSIPTFHGYSATGNVTGQFVYVNYGTYQDYEDLIRAGIDLHGKIAIAKYGGIFRGLKVRRAQELGMIGAILYSDPGDDGKMTEENGYKSYPNGPARQPTSVQRGSVVNLSAQPGDPTTPGYPSKLGVPRAPTDSTIPSIPSIPISYADALPILKALNGHGPRATDLGNPWTRNLGLTAKGVEYNIGPSPDDNVLSLYNKQEYVTTPQWNVIGIVNGTIPDQVIVIGNHRDAWIVGGAADPNSGSAILNEVVRSVGVALERGWKPHRTIVFASWDGEEYGLIGSTEWVEEYLPWLDKANVAYVNVDVGVSGPIFTASAAPLLRQVLRDATKLVPSTNQTTKGQTIGDLWDGKISTIGSGSDFVAFQDYAGVPCLDVSFVNGPDSPVYHYHSNYDSFWWMNNFGDPGFQVHRSMAQLVGLVISELSENRIISFHAAEYADALGSYLDQVEEKLARSERKDGDHHFDLETMNDEALFLERARLTFNASAVVDDVLAQEKAGALKRSLGKMRHSLTHFRKVAAELDDEAERTRQKLDDGVAWWNLLGKVRLGVTILTINTKYKELERHFLFEKGLDGRNWYKHVVFAPGLWTGYSGAVYPGIMESLDTKDYTNALKWSRIIDKCIRKATKSLQ